MTSTRARPRAAGSAGRVSDTPWSGRDAIKAAVLILVGAALWFVGWWEVSDRASIDRQVAPFNLAIVGILVLGVGQASWFMAGRRAVGERRRAIVNVDVPRRPAAVVDRAAAELFVGEERFFHHLDCAMVLNRQWAPAPRAVHESAGRIPCGVCKP